MSTLAMPVLPPARTATARVLAAGAAVAVLDGLFAVAFTAAVTGGLAPVRVFQGIARAVLGPAALDGGSAAAALGLAIHVAVAYGWTVLYALALRNAPALRRAVADPLRAVAVGAAYGALVWLVMRLVVIPLGHGGGGPIVARTFATMLVGHMIVVGQPIVLLLRPRAER